MTKRSIFSLLLLLAGACDRPSPATTASASTGPAASIVDSALPREELLRRFREGVPEVTSFTGGARSRDALARQVIRALETRDTTTLRALMVTRPEFAWLYYPTSAQGLPPYDLSPGLYWFMLEQRSARGLRWLLEERSGAPLHYVGLDCGSKANTEGENVTWGPCLIRRVQAPGDTISERYFSLIVERDGRYKVLAYHSGHD